MEVKTRRGWFGTLRSNLQGQWPMIWLFAAFGFGVLGLMVGVLLMMG